MKTWTSSAALVAGIFLCCGMIRDTEGCVAKHGTRENPLVVPLLPPSLVDKIAAVVKDHFKTKIKAPFAKLGGPNNKNFLYSHMMKYPNYQYLYGNKFPYNVKQTNEIHYGNKFQGNYLEKTPHSIKHGNYHGSVNTLGYDGFVPSTHPTYTEYWSEGPFETFSQYPHPHYGPGYPHF